MKTYCRPHDGRRHNARAPWGVASQFLQELNCWGGFQVALSCFLRLWMFRYRGGFAPLSLYLHRGGMALVVLHLRWFRFPFCSALGVGFCWSRCICGGFVWPSCGSAFGVGPTDAKPTPTPRESQKKTTGNETKAKQRRPKATNPQQTPNLGHCSMAPGRVPHSSIRNRRKSPLW